MSKHSMMRVVLGLCVLHLGVNGLMARAAGPDDSRSQSWLHQPFWETKTMTNEPVLFVQEEGKTLATGKLFFVPSSKPRVTHPDQVMVYVEGQDYTWKPGTNIIELTPYSRIPFKTYSQMHPPKKAPNQLGGALWSEGHFFHDLQMQVTYEHEETWAPPALPKGESLPRSLAKLRAVRKKEFKIVAMGDSITEGYNASGFKKSYAPPYQPPYPQLLVDCLSERFSVPISLINYALAGTTASEDFVPVLRTLKPDLVLVAWGMNHFDRPEAFEATYRKILAGIQANAPEADIVMVAPMTIARSYKGDRFHLYLDVLRKLEAANVALVDVTTPWISVMERKPYYDITGNNFNHPNDFTHRLYAHLILRLFPLIAAGGAR